VPARYPQRIVCLTEETTETLYLLGEQRRIVGVSGYTVRPPEARRDKPKVSAFLSAKTGKILELEPDLVLGFSDLQADIARELAKAGLNVMIFNQRSVDEILSMILTLSAMVGAADKGRKLIDDIEKGLESIRLSAKRFPRRPRVYFEEWDEPMISAIRWVSELIELAGGEDVFSSLSLSAGASGRTIADPAEVVRRRAPRDQVGRHPAARPRGAHRRRAPHPRDPHWLGSRPLSWNAGALPSLSCPAYTVMCGNGISMPRAS
jgi:iron complex transport system substrate-binding protein